jgi:4-hydroxybenzoate polyprenyltransferase
MYLCYTHQIHLLYLPPHTSHVLQPLDQSVFGPLKAAYKKELGYLAQWNDSTVVGKRQFLDCYRKARQSALTAQNIKAGWKSTGLWPVNTAKPLMSPLLLDESRDGSTTVNPILDRPLGSTPITQWDIASSSVNWSTPRKALDLRDQLDQYSRLDQPSSTQRLLFRKVQKGFQEKDYQLATLQRRVEALEQQVESIRPRKKKKVQISPNSKFADIEAIHRAQVDAGDKSDSIAESSDTDSPSEAEDCIVVGS